MRATRTALALSLSALLLFPPGAFAGNAGFFTTYTSEVEKGEVELMLMSDLTLPSSLQEGQGTYVSQMFEIEVGVTSQYATELMLEGFADLHSREISFTGFRWENRYRLFERPVPLNPMIYFEYEDLAPNTRYKMEVSGWVRPPYLAQERGGRERIIESRLVLSEQLGPFSVAANGIFETDLHSWDTAFGYAVGVMWMPGHAHHTQASADDGNCPMHPDVRADSTGHCPICGMAVGKAEAQANCDCPQEMKGCGCAHCAGGDSPCTCAHGSSFGFGLELFGALGDTHAFGLVPSRQEHYLAPVVVWHATPHWMVHAQMARGLSRASDNLFRVNVAYEF